MANFNFNKVMLGGRLSADPELKSTQSGISVTSFSVAVNRKAKGTEEAKADFINCVAWRNTAEFITRFFKKGSSIFVMGTLQTRNWTDRDGRKHYITEIVVDEAYFVDSKGEQASAPAPAAYIPDAYLTPPTEFEAAGEDEDLPF